MDQCYTSGMSQCRKNSEAGASDLLWAVGLGGWLGADGRAVLT